MCIRDRYKEHDYISLSSCDNKVHIYELTKNKELNFLNHLQGHTNKIKEMSFAEIDGNGYLASGSLDNYIRIWGFRPVDELEARYKKSKYVYYMNDSHFVTLDSVLFGHTEGISGVKFFKDIQGKSKIFKKITNFKNPQITKSQTGFKQFRLFHFNMGRRPHLSLIHI